MTPAQATHRLLRSFRARKPLRAGSLLVTLFGDSIAPRGGVVTLGSLIRLAAFFGLPERLVRTSVARLALEGWLLARREGRRSEYRLTPDGAHRFADATRRIYGAAPTSWNGHWTLLLLPPVPARERERLRTELRWLGFGQWANGLLAHPSANITQTRKWLRQLGGPSQVVVLQTSGGELAADRCLAAAGWDLADLGRRYRRFIAAFEPVRAALAAASSQVTVAGSKTGTPDVTAGRKRPKAAPALEPEAAFVIRTLLIHEYRKIHLQDPLLPAPLLPPDWVGTAAFELCRALYNAVFTTAETCLTAAASTLTGELPAFDTRAHVRFRAPASKVPEGARR
jgi:phenylacetic acid degradation operon negative regulatory protein